jgi:MinD superfamily P-loop ATPase
VLSGKGGTGKTTITAALAHLLAGRAWAVLVDADVDASNLGLLLEPRVREANEFIGGEVAEIERDRCALCGECERVCRFDAVRNGSVDPLACEGCRACLHACPANAIRMRPTVDGEWFRSDTRFGALFHAELFPGKENSGKLVSAVRRAADDWAQSVGADLILIDGPPGIGCPAIAATTGVDLALLVAEPTISGVEDLGRALDLVAHFGVPAIVCINKADLNERRADEIEAACAERGLPWPVRIPFDEGVQSAACARGIASERGPEHVARALRRLLDSLRGPLRDPAGKVTV